MDEEVVHEEEERAREHDGHDGVVVLAEEDDLVVHHLEHFLCRRAVSTGVAAVVQQASKDEAAAVLCLFLGHRRKPLELPPQQLEESEREAESLESLNLAGGGEGVVVLVELPDFADSDDAATVATAKGGQVELVAVCGWLPHHLLLSHDNVAAALEQVASIVDLMGSLLDVVVMASTPWGSGSLTTLLVFFQLLGHVGVDEPGVLAMGVRVLADLSVGNPLHDPGGTEDPEDGEQRLPAGAPDVEEDEASQPDDAAGALDGAGEAAHADLVHLLAEELDQEHPREDQPGPHRQLGRRTAARRR